MPYYDLLKISELDKGCKNKNCANCDYVFTELDFLKTYIKFYGCNEKDSIFVKDNEEYMRESKKLKYVVCSDYKNGR